MILDISNYRLPIVNIKKKKKKKKKKKLIFDWKDTEKKPRP